MTKQKTPLQELIEWIDRVKKLQSDDYLHMENVKSKATELLEKERESIEDAYRTAQTYASDKFDNATDYFNQTFIQ